MPASEHLKILVVEDQYGHSRFAHQMLEGQHCIDARTGTEALKLFMEEDPDMVLLDIGLPDKSGMDVLTEMKALKPESFIVMFTASRYEHDVHGAIERGAAGYITKPITYSKIAKYLPFHTEFKQRLAETAPEEKARLHEEFRTRAASLIAEQRIKPETETGWNILYVDPDKTNGNRVRERLTAAGCYLDTATTAEAALKRIKRAPYDFVFISSPLPDMEAAMLALQLRQKHKALPIAMLLEHAWEKNNPKWLILNITEFLVKPVKTRHLLQVVERTLTQQLETEHERYVQ